MRSRESIEAKIAELQARAAALPKRRDHVNDMTRGDMLYMQIEALEWVLEETGDL